MLVLIAYGLLISFASHVESTSADYQYYPDTGGSVKLYQVPATWDQAFLQCHKDNSILASPVTYQMRTVMESIMGKYANLSYFIGTSSQFSSNQYVSIEGVTLANMPVDDMYEPLNKQNGECLSMSETKISPVSCSVSLPYFCYRKLECGTTDKEYRYQPSTNSCYKVHKELTSWPDANLKCISEGGYLAIVNNEMEARMITNLIPNIRTSWSSKYQWEGMYIGALDWTGKGTWLTVHGEALNGLFNSWDQGQPDSIGRSRCVVVNRSNKLDNNFCNYLATFICEKERTNTPYCQDMRNQN